uniref:Uncharacterized protein n=1 Tax=Vespula pensylvanica TaxID=30213 RepID=A0A834P8D7_VESPE|nr:hypothetical protein H0235_004439 [Vespula pensylvanica]
MESGSTASDSPRASARAEVAAKCCATTTEYRRWSSAPPPFSVSYHRYEKVHFLGEDGQQADDEDEDSRHRKWSARALHSVPLTYNHHQHNVAGGEFLFCHLNVVFLCSLVVINILLSLNGHKDVKNLLKGVCEIQTLTEPMSCNDSTQYSFHNPEPSLMSDQVQTQQTQQNYY